MSTRAAETKSARTRELRRRTRLLQTGVTAALTMVLVVVGSTTAFAAGLPTGPSATEVTGLRPNATRYSFSVDDRLQATVDVGTGNLNLSANLLALPGINGQATIGLAYNSVDGTGGAGGASSMNGPAWTWSLDGAGALSIQSDGSTIDYTDGSGAVWPFTYSSSSGLYTSPGGLKAVLTKNSSGIYTLVFSQSSATITFNASGQAQSVADRNHNTTSIAFPSSTQATVTSTMGPTNARVATLTYAVGSYGGYPTYGTTISQSSGGISRSVSVAQTSTGAVTGVTDATGASTSFTYNGSGLISKITNPDGEQTSVTYDTSKRVTEVDQANTTTGSAGTSTTRFSYVSAAETQVASPDTSTGSPVSSVAHADYTLDANHMVTTEKDAALRKHTTAFNTNLDVKTATTGDSSASGATAAPTVTTQYGWTDNNQQSLNSVTAQSGNESYSNYGSGATAFLPSSTTADKNTSNTTVSNYTYDGVGNMLTSSTAAGASGVAATATVTRNQYGQVTTATAPRNGSGQYANSTTYTYDSSGYHELSTITPVSGSSLGTKSFTYDALARLVAETDGAGNTTSYTYDKDDRVLTTSFSDSTPTVTNTYDGAGNLTKQVSGGGTISNTYDQLNQLTSTTNSAAGGAEQFGYDAAGLQTSLTDARGTTTETYDAAGVLTSTIYPKGTGTQKTTFVTDSDGRLMDEYLQSTGTNNAGWADHVHTSYDASGRVSEVLAELGPAATKTTEMDTVYCYNSGGSGSTCGTSTSTDFSKLQWTYDKVSGQTTHFTYDGAGRLTGVAQSGGSGSNDTWAYTYDANGNRTEAKVTGTDASDQQLTFNAANQITSTGYSYDGAGNMTASPGATYTYNAAEQMTSATVGGTTYNYTYAGASQKAVLSETGGAHTYQLVYGRTDSEGNPEIAQYLVTTSGSTATAYVEQDPTTGQATMLHTSSDIAALYVYDGIGDPVGLLTDFATKAYTESYDPYGLPTVTSNDGGNGYKQNPYQFKAGIQDRGSGFVKFGARWYDPATGTWTQEDTLDSPLDPANADRYAFGGDDPINSSDPQGTVTCFNAVLNYYGVVGLLGVGLVGAALGALGELPSGGTDTIVTALGIGTTSFTLLTLPAAENGVDDACGPGSLALIQSISI